MKTCYTLRDRFADSRAIADLCDAREIGLKGFLLTRIQVPLRERNRGRGTSLLQDILRDADKEQVTVWLEIQPYGSLDYDQLVQWYGKHGFKPTKWGFYARRPAKQEPII